MSNLLSTSTRPVVGLLRTATRRAVHNAASATQALGEQNRDRSMLRPPGAGTRTRRAGEVSQLSRDECLRLLASASLVRGVRDGYVRDLEHPDHALGGEDVFALQGKLHWLFSRRANLLISADASTQLRSGCALKLDVSYRY